MTMHSSLSSGNLQTTPPPRTANGRSGSWSVKRGSHNDTTRAAGRNAMQNTRWKIVLAAIGVLMLHVISANIVIPVLTNRIISGSDTESTPGLGFLGDTSSSSTSLSTTSLSTVTDSNGGGIIRLLTETAAAFNAGDAALTTEQMELLARYGDKATRGRDIWIRSDGLTNPLTNPPHDLKASRNPKNIRKYKARTLNTLYRDKCRNETIIPYNGKTGKEWVTSSRAWTKLFSSEVSRFRWCRGGSEQEVPDLKQVLLLKSDKPRPQRAVTIVTQLSLERTSMLEQQCTHWPHPIAAVVYIPIVRGKIFSGEDNEWHLSPIEKGLDEMNAFYNRMKNSQCILDLEVVVEERCSNDLASMYPTNAVRNRALMLAQTEIVLLLDVDFVVDLSLITSLEGDERVYNELKAALDSRKALVLPAFEAWDQSEWGKRLALDAVKKGKAFITQKFMYNVVIGFHMSHYPQGHEKTNFWRWINTTQAYKVQYQLGFEPYILMSRKFVPYYDERFRGYYWNKVQHLMHISLQNRFSFVIHPTSFVVHVPHRKPTTKWRTKRSGQKERNHVMFLEALEDMKRDRFVPVTGFPHLCLPPLLQQAAAKVIANADQKSALEEMSTVVAPLQEENFKGAWMALPTTTSHGNGDSSSSSSSANTNTPSQTNKNKSSNNKNNNNNNNNEDIVDGEPRGELAKQERPIVVVAAAQKAKINVEEQVLAAEELRQDLEDLAVAEANAMAELAVPAEELEAVEAAAAAAEAREISETVQMIVDKEHDVLDASAGVIGDEVDEDADAAADVEAQERRWKAEAEQQTEEGGGEGVTMLEETRGDEIKKRPVVDDVVVPKKGVVGTRIEMKKSRKPQLDI